MRERLREWGFPIGLLLLWTIAAVFTVYALVGMEMAVERTQAHSQSMQMVAKPVATTGPKAAPAS
jgi:hypothetical protein